MRGWMSVCVHSEGAVCAVGRDEKERGLTTFVYIGRLLKKIQLVRYARIFWDVEFAHEIFV